MCKLMRRYISSVSSQSLIFVWLHKAACRWTLNRKQLCVLFLMLHLTLIVIQLPVLLLTLLYCSCYYYLYVVWWCQHREITVLPLSVLCWLSQNPHCTARLEFWWEINGFLFIIYIVGLNVFKFEYIESELV